MAPECLLGSKRLKPYKNSWWRYLRFEKVITSDRIMSMISKSRSDRIESVTKVTDTEDRRHRNVRTLICRTPLHKSPWRGNYDSCFILSRVFKRILSLFCSAAHPETKRLVLRRNIDQAYTKQLWTSDEDFTDSYLEGYSSFLGKISNVIMFSSWYVVYLWVLVSSSFAFGGEKIGEQKKK